MDNRRPSKMKALTLGACDYWTKPLYDNQFERMWTHVFKKYISEDEMQKGPSKIREISNNYEFGLSMAHTSNDNFRKVDHNVGESKNSNPSSIRKNCVVWSPELHDAFVKAIEEVGIESMILHGLFFFICPYLYFFVCIVTFLDYFLL